MYSESQPSRRDVVRKTVKFAFTAPVVSTFFASQAYAANYSCYLEGHSCNPGGEDNEDCCEGLTCVPQGEGEPRCEVP